jgi:predicted double-glycine peptidase
VHVYKITSVAIFATACCTLAISLLPVGVSSDQVPSSPVLSQAPYDRVAMFVVEEKNEESEDTNDEAVAREHDYAPDTLDVPVSAISEDIPEEPAHAIPTIPFYSQFTDIHKAGWQKIGCGIASLAMIVNYYSPGEATVDELLEEGIASGAYIASAGWSHQGLAHLAEAHGFSSTPRDMSGWSMDAAYEELKDALEEGMVIASVYYTFTPGHPIPHLVVVRGIEDGTVYYSDPSEQNGNGSLSVEKFKAAWKKRYIAVRP